MANDFLYMIVIILGLSLLTDVADNAGLTITSQYI